MALVPGKLSSLCLGLWAAISVSLSGAGQCWWAGILSYHPAQPKSPPPWEATFKTLRNYRVENVELFLTSYQGKTFDLACVVQLPSLHFGELPGSFFLFDKHISKNLPFSGISTSALKSREFYYTPD